MWALDLLLNEYESHRSNAAGDLYHHIVGLSSAAYPSVAGSWRQVLKYFDSLEGTQVAL
jgi:hypothetical protein